MLLDLRSLFERPATNWLPTTGQGDRPPLNARPDNSAIETRLFFRPPAPATWLPTAGQEDRLPAQKRPPDEPGAYFRTPSSFPAIWLPTTGQEDRPLAPQKRPPDESFPWFVRSPSPVPTAWLPQWDGWERPARINLDPSVAAFSFKAPAVVSTIAGMAWFNPPDTRLPPVLGDPYAVQTLPPFLEPPLLTFMAQTNADDFSPLKPAVSRDVPAGWPPHPPFGAVSTISGIAWHNPSEDKERLPAVLRSPDEATPFFVRSPSPVPQRWLPTTGEEDRPPAQKRPPDEPTGYFFQKPSVVATPSIWWGVGQDGYIKPIPRPPDEPFPWFVRSPSPVPQRWLPVTGEEDRPPNPNRIRAPDEPGAYFRLPSSFQPIWLPTAGETEHIRPLPPDPYRLGSLLRQIVPPVAISGMAWWRQTEVYVGPPPPQVDYRPAWDPQVVVQLVVVLAPDAAFASDFPLFAAPAADRANFQVATSGSNPLATYEIDTNAQINATFINSLTGVATDPSTVTLYIIPPNGPMQTLVFGSSSIVKDGPGLYHYILTLSISGTWTYKWQGTGAVIATSPDTTLTVKSSALIAG